MYTPTCCLVVFPSQFNVRSPVSHDFSAWTQVKFRQIFTIFAFSFSGQKLNSKNAISFFVHPNFLQLLKSWKTAEDLHYAVKMSRSISTWQSWDKQLTKPFKLITHFPEIPLIFIAVVFVAHNVIPVSLHHTFLLRHAHLPCSVRHDRPLCKKYLPFVAYLHV